MTAKYYLTESAHADREDIWLYISKDNIDAANKVDDRFSEIFLQIAENPYFGHLREDLTSKNLRFVAIYSYLIVYDASKEPIEIIRILSGYRDVANIL